MIQLAMGVVGVLLLASAIGLWPAVGVAMIAIALTVK